MLPFGNLLHFVIMSESSRLHQMASFGEFVALLYFVYQKYLAIRGNFKIKFYAERQVRCQGKISLQCTVSSVRSQEYMFRDKQSLYRMELAFCVSLVIRTPVLDFKSN